MRHEVLAFAELPEYALAFVLDVVIVDANMVWMWMVKLYVRNEEIGAFTKRANVIGVLDGMALDEEGELCVLTKVKEIEYFVGEFWCDVGGAVEVDPVWVCFWDFPGGFANIARCKIRDGIVLAEDVAENDFVVASSKVAVDKSGGSIRNASL